MDYISFKELALNRQIDPSRIVRLAKAGLIPNAMLVGNSWMFPADSELLPDDRKRENKRTVNRKSFRFPHYFYTKYAEAALRQFTEDERILYDGEYAYLRGEYANRSSIFEKADTYSKKELVQLYTDAMQSY